MRKSGSFVVRCEVLVVMNMKILVFLDVMQCSCLDRYQSLGGIC